MGDVQLLVWGATGVTGKRVCQRLATEYQGVIKWGMAARSREKLASLREELAEVNDGCRDVPLLVADVQEKSSVDAMVRETEVVLACAGPFSRYSDAVVESCVKEGRHFLDVTGEVLWVKSVIDRFDDEAKRKGVKIVNFCGFDSVPADVGAYFIADHVKKRYGCGPSRVLACYRTKMAASMPASGGTVATMIDIIGQDATQRKLNANPYVLNPPNTRPKHESLPDGYGPRYDKEFGFWTSPFLMQSVNKRAVQRSYALCPDHYGPSFTYSECVKAKGYFGALMPALWNILLGLCIVFSPLRALLFALGALPKPGQGPSVEDEEKSNWKLTLHTLVEPESAADKPITVRTSISDNFGGYTSTARMAIECAMCLLLEKDDLKKQSLPKGGVLTPAAAFGDVLVQRLNVIGIKSEVL